MGPGHLPGPPAVASRDGPGLTEPCCLVKNKFQSNFFLFFYFSSSHKTSSRMEGQGSGEKAALSSSGCGAGPLPLTWVDGPWETPCRTGPLAQGGSECAGTVVACLCSMTRGHPQPLQKATTPAGALTCPRVAAGRSPRGPCKGPVRALGEHSPALPTSRHGSGPLASSLWASVSPTEHKE